MATLDDLMTGLSASDQKEVRKRARAHIQMMRDARRLDELRRALNKNQGEVAQAMGIGQNAVSQMEKRLDLQLSTLHRYLQGLGFGLEISAVSKTGERIALKKFKPWLEPQAVVLTASEPSPEFLVKSKSTPKR
jgi:transcriptional regulator with XRE-family HTH domain